MVRSMVEGAVPFVCMMVGLYVTMALAVWRLKATTRKAAEMSRRAAVLATLLETNKFCLGIVAAFQMMASSGSSMPPDLPSAVSYLFTFLSFFNADSSAVSYEGCDPKTYPFAVPLGSMVVALVLMGLHGLLELQKTRRRRQDKASSISAGAGLGEGATVLHGNCGQGVVVTIDDAVEPGKPVLVQFKTGDLSRYSLEEAKKLEVQPSASNTLSRVQALIFTALLVLYALIAKNCLRFLNCRRSPTGELVLASGPATSRTAVVEGTAVTEMVLMRFVAPRGHKRMSKRRTLVLVGRPSRCGSALYQPLCSASAWHATLFLRVPKATHAGVGRVSISPWECSLSSSLSR
jgi:hypothetical protein